MQKLIMTNRRRKSDNDIYYDGFITILENACQMHVLTYYKWLIMWESFGAILRFDREVIFDTIS